MEPLTDGLVATWAYWHSGLEGDMKTQSAAGWSEASVVTWACNWQLNVRGLSYRID